MTEEAAWGLVLVLAVALSAAFIWRHRLMGRAQRIASHLEIRRLVLSLALLTIAGTALYPPWSYTFTAAGAGQVVRPAPRALLFEPPKRELDSVRFGVRLDLPRLLVEWIIVASVAGAFLVFTPRRPRGGIGTQPNAPPQPDQFTTIE